MYKDLKPIFYKAVLLSMVLSLLAFTIALAASGDLDTTFDGDGRVTTGFPGSNDSDSAYDIAIQADGKIVVAGSRHDVSTDNSDFAVLRYNPNGTLDTTFSGDGKLTTNFGGNDEAWGVAVQSDGKIVAGGSKCNNAFTICDVALARYNSNGTLDTTFSSDGKVLNNSGGGLNGANSLAMQPDGKIVMAGFRHNGTDIDLAVYRFKTNGILDTTFSGDGVVVGNFGVGNAFGLDLEIQSNGKIVVAGHDDNNFIVARLNSNGTGDTTFSGDGLQITNFGADDRAFGLTVQPDNKIVVVGGKCSPSCSVAIARYTTNGSLDTTFNGTGRRVFSFVPGQQSLGQDVVVMSNGKIVVAGFATGASPDFGIARLLPSGAFDTSFSGDGKLNIDFGEDDSAYGLATQPADGKYVLAGPASVSLFDIGLARVLP